MILGGRFRQGDVSPAVTNSAAGAWRGERQTASGPRSSGCGPCWKDGKAIAEARIAPFLSSCSAFSPRARPTPRSGAHRLRAASGGVVAGLFELMFRDRAYPEQLP